MTRRLLGALLLVLALAAPGTALAATPKVEFTDIENELMCVTCNVPLTVAESPQATAQRQEVRRLIAQGLTREQVLDRMVDQYGENVLATPKRDGVGLAAYLVPIGVGALLVALAVVLLPRWRRRRAEGGDRIAPAGPALDEADARRLDADLARYDL